MSGSRSQAAAADARAANAVAQRETVVDVAVVGGGASGLAAALWIARYRRSVLVMDSGEYRAAAVERSHGYLGRDPQTPTDLIADGRRDLLAYPTAAHRSGRVARARRRDDGLFALTVAAGTEPSYEVLAHRVVLATGVFDAFPDVSGFAEHYGAGAFHCPACDGYEAKDCDVVALGWEARLVAFAATLLGWARSVTVVTAGRRFEGDETCRALLSRESIELVEDDAVELIGRRGALRALRLRGGRKLPCSLLFFSFAHLPRTDLATELGCAVDEEGYVAVDAEGRTTVPGVYAAGDLVPGLQLTQVAAAKGTVAGVACAQSLFGEPGAPTSPPAPPDVVAELVGG